MIYWVYLKKSLKPRSHAMIYTRYVNYKFAPGVKIYLLRVRMVLKSFGPTVDKSFSLRRRLIFVGKRSMIARTTLFFPDN